MCCKKFDCCRTASLSIEPFSKGVKPFWSIYLAIAYEIPLYNLLRSNDSSFNIHSLGWKHRILPAWPQDKQLHHGLMKSLSLWSSKCTTIINLDIRVAVYIRYNIDYGTSLHIIIFFTNWVLETQQEYYILIFIFSLFVSCALQNWWF